MPIYNILHQMRACNMKQNNYNFAENSLELKFLSAVLV